MKISRAGRFAFRPELFWSDRLGLALAPLGIVAAGALGLAIAQGASANTVDGDGHGVDSPAYVSGLAPAKRVEHDFASGLLESGDNCLEPTGYDPADYTKYGDSRKPHAVGTVSLESGVIRVVPGDPNKGEPVLELLLNDGTKPLQPANQASAGLLAQLGCELQY